MQCVVLAWEQGGNWGHLARLRFIANALKRQGAHVILAVPQQRITKALLNGPWQVVSLPALQAVTSHFHTYSYADVLFRIGLGNVDALSRVLSHWILFLSKIKPVSVVLDYAVCAQLASMLLGIRTFKISNGFDSPPPDCPTYDNQLRGAYVEQKNHLHKQKLSSCLSQAAEQAVGINSVTLEEFLAYPEIYFDVVPESDPYGPRLDPERYLGPLKDRASEFTSFSWPEVEGGQRRLFAYLRMSSPGMVDLLCVLSEISASTVCVCPDITDEQIAAFSNRTTVITRNPVDLDKALSQSSAVISYGSAAINTYSILHGKPMLIAPTDREKAIIANHLAKQGLALILHSGSAQVNRELLEQLLGNNVLKNNVKKTKDKYSEVMLIERKCQFIYKLIH